MGNQQIVRQTLAAGLLYCTCLSLGVIGVTVPAHADPAVSPGQPCGDLDRVSYQYSNSGLVCGGNGHGQPGLWGPVPTVDTIAPATLGNPCNFPAGTRAIAADPANNNGPYLGMCSQDRVWTKFRP